MSDFERGIEGRPVDEVALILAHLIAQINACVPVDLLPLDEARKGLLVLEYMSAARFAILDYSPDNPHAPLPGDGAAMSAKEFLLAVLDEIDSTSDALKPDCTKAYRQAFDRIARLCKTAEPLWERAREARPSRVSDDIRWGIADDPAPLFKPTWRRRV